MRKVLLFLEITESLGIRLRGIKNVFMLRCWIYQGIFLLSVLMGGKNPSQQRETLPVPQVPIRLTTIWNGKLDEVMDPLPF